MKEKTNTQDCKEMSSSGTCRAIMKDVTFVLSESQRRGGAEKHLKK